MPCQPRKARRLLQEGKAQVARMVPFTIQLLYGSSGYTQAIALGVDAGTQRIGVSATTKQHVLFEAVATLTYAPSMEQRSMPVPVAKS